MSTPTDQPRDTRQHIIVMRHGDRIDNVEPLWISTALRPWDPQLIESGKVRAFCTGRKLRKSLGFGIDRVFVSPFLRCVQTANEALLGLCAVNDNPLELSSDNVEIDASKIKVSIEYGICEVLSKEAIRPDLAPKDGDWGFNIAELEAMLPAGTVDHSIERVYKEMPQWEETIAEARERYLRVIVALADKYPTENLLIVTHGEGVGVAVSGFLKEATVYEVEYCAYAHLERETSISPKFELVTASVQSGILYLSNNPTL